MASISHSDLAPSEPVEFVFSSESFVLGPGDTFETDNRVTISNARVHPWLKVEVENVENISGVFRRTLADTPELDAMTSAHPNFKTAFDPGAIEADEARKAAVEESRLAVDASLDQEEAVTLAEGVEGHEVAVTLAADESHEEASGAKDFQMKDDADPAADAAVAMRDVPEPGPVVEKETTKKSTSTKKGDK